MIRVSRKSAAELTLSKLRLVAELALNFEILYTLQRAAGLMLPVHAQLAAVAQSWPVVRRRLAQVVVPQLPLHLLDRGRSSALPALVSLKRVYKSIV